jgi:ribose transport system substrate-binding protein
MRVGRLMAALCAASVLVVLTVGCGSSGSSPSSSPVAAAATSGASGSAPTSADFVTQAKQALAINYRGTDGELPTSAPRPPAHESVWIIACSLAAEGCKDPGEGAAEAARALGWQVHLVDGKLDPSVYNSLIRDAIAARANAIVLVSVDCALTRASLEAAKQAGVKIVGLYALDCNTKYGGGGPPLFDTQIVYENGMTYQGWLLGPYSQSAADWVIARTDGKANVIDMRESDVASVRLVGDGFQAAMGKCTTCKLTVVPFTGADLLNGTLQSKVQTALAQDPQADVVFSPYDAAVSLGIAAGVAASGRGSQVLVVGGEGLTPNIQMIKSGKGQSFAAGAPARWVGWAAIDELIRAFHGEKPVDEGIGLQSIDHSHNVPTATSYYDGNVGADGKPRQGYVANFKKIWGVR